MNPSLGYIFRDLHAAGVELHRRRIALVDAHAHWTHPTDARIVMIARLEALAQSAALSVAFNGAYLIDPAWWSSTSDGDGPSHRQAVESFELFTRSAFLTSMFATFENGCRIALRHLEPNNPALAEQPFHYVVNELTRRLASVPQEAWPLVKLLRLTRNTIHNNGLVFDSRSEVVEVQYNGSTFKFEHGRHIEFATWGFLVQRFRELGALTCIIASAPPLGAADVVLDPAYQ